MGKRGRILIAVAAVIIVGVAGWSIFRAWSASREPMYKGRPLSHWLQGYWPVTIPPPGMTPTAADADAAIQETGTNAIPTLLRLLQTQYSPFKIKLVRWAYGIPYIRNHYPRPFLENIEAIRGFMKLGQDAAPAVPDLINILNKNSNSNLTQYSIVILGRIGPPAAGAVPTLLRLATGTNQTARRGALGALGQIQSEPSMVVPVLINALHDPSAEIRAAAAGGLMGFGTNASSAVPALLDIISEPEGGSNSLPVYPGRLAGLNPSVRTFAEQSLKMIDPETYSVMVTNVLPLPAWK